MGVEDLHRASFHALDTPRLFLRPLVAEDAEDMFAYTSLPESFRYLRREHHLSVEEDQAYIEGILEGYRLHREFVWGVCLREENHVIGTCRMYDVRPAEGRCSLAYLIHPAFQGHGIASEAISRIIRYAFEELNFREVWAQCVTENIASERIMQKSGMTKRQTLLRYIERKGALRDVYLYSIRRDEKKD